MTNESPDASKLSLLSWTAPDADALFSHPGVYQLYIHVPHSGRRTIGGLGNFEFPAGLYFYTGSALGGIRRRVSRHLRDEKRLRWHIDFLLNRTQIDNP